MATEKRLIYLEDAIAKIVDTPSAIAERLAKCEYGYYQNPDMLVDRQHEIIDLLTDVSTVDAVDIADFDEILYKLECLLCHATGGRYSKAGYALEDMCRMVTDHIEECCEEAVAEEAVHGRWLYNSYTDHYFCSACNKEALHTSIDKPVYDYDWEENLRYSHTETIFEGLLTDYCPNCGADMRGDGDG